MFDTGLLEHVLHRVEERVLARVDDLLDAGVDEKLRAREARRDRDVRRPPVDGVPVLGRLADRVLLGVDAEALVEMRAALRLPRAARTPPFEAVLHVVRGAVVAGREDVAVLDDHRADMTARAVRARGDDVRQRHEVLVPARTRILDLPCH